VSEYSGLTSIVDISMTKHKVNAKGGNKRNTDSELPNFGGKNRKSKKSIQSSMTEETPKKAKGRSMPEKATPKKKEYKKEKELEAVAVTVGEKAPEPQ